MTKEDRILEKILRKITLCATLRCKILPEPLRSDALDYLQKTLDKQSGKTTSLLPYLLVASTGKKLPEKTCVGISIDCGLLNIFGWMAYSIYDDIIDGAETPRLLPLANTFHREMCRCLILCEKETADNHLSEKILDLMDSAQLREYDSRSDNNFRSIPSFRNTIEKSIGFALPSLFALKRAKIVKGKDNTDTFLRFFSRYIFIKQISDDIRDWREDKSRNIPTRITERMRGRKGSDFVKHAFIAESNEIIRHSRAAKRILSASNLFPVNSIAYSLIESHESVARKILEKYRK